MSDNIKIGENNIIGMRKGNDKILKLYHGQDLLFTDPSANWSITNNGQDITRLTFPYTMIESPWSGTTTTINNELSITGIGLDNTGQPTGIFDGNSDTFGDIRARLAAYPLYYDGFQFGVDNYNEAPGLAEDYLKFRADGTVEDIVSEFQPFIAEVPENFISYDPINDEITFGAGTYDGSSYINAPISLDQDVVVPRDIGTTSYQRWYTETLDGIQCITEVSVPSIIIYPFLFRANSSTPEGATSVQIRKYYSSYDSGLRVCWHSSYYTYYYQNVTDQYTNLSNSSGYACSGFYLFSNSNRQFTMTRDQYFWLKVNLDHSQIDPQIKEGYTYNLMARTIPHAYIDTIVAYIDSNDQQVNLITQQGSANLKQIDIPITAAQIKEAKALVLGITAKRGSIGSSASITGSNAYITIQIRGTYNASHSQKIELGTNTTGISASAHAQQTNNVLYFNISNGSLESITSNPLYNVLDL